MWCRNKDRIVLHSSLTDEEKYILLDDIYHRWDILVYPSPKIYREDIDGKGRLNVIIYDI